MNKVERTILVLSTIFRTIIIVAISIAVMEKQWITLFLSVLTLLLTFFPAIIERNYRITLPLEFEFLIIFFYLWLAFFRRSRRLL